MFLAPLLLLLTFAPPAQAGSWGLTYTASGTETTTPYDPLSPPNNAFSDTATGTNTVGSTKKWTTGFGFPGSVSTTQTITVTVKGKWVSTGGDNSTDPAPTSVIVVESVKMDQDGTNGDGSLATGNFDDAFGDQPSPTGQGVTDQTCGTPNTISVQHQTPESGGSFTITHTFTVGSTATTNSPRNAASAAAHFDSYSATIHPQPYNYHKTSAVDNLYSKPS